MFHSRIIHSYPYRKSSILIFTVAVSLYIITVIVVHTYRSYCCALSSTVLLYMLYAWCTVGSYVPTSESVDPHLHCFSSLYPRLVCVVPVYIVGGLIVNAIRGKRTASELFPNFQFWKGFPYLLLVSMRAWSLMSVCCGIPYLLICMLPDLCLASVYAICIL